MFMSVIGVFDRSGVVAQGLCNCGSGCSLDGKLGIATHSNVYERTK